MRNRFAWMPVALGGILLTSFCFYPGVINGDSAWQLGQARSAHYVDWHPPLMSFVWRFIHFVLPGTGGIFLLHLSLFWVGLCVFAFNALPNPLFWVLGPLCVGFYPPVFYAFGMIVKDNGFLAALTFVCGMLLNAEAQKSRLSLLLAGVALSYAFGLRQNAFIAIAPLCFWGSKILTSRPLASRRALLLGTGCFALIAAGMLAFTQGILRPEKRYSSQAVMLFDLVAISVDTRTNYLPALYNRDGPPFSTDDLKAVLRPHDGTNLLWQGWAGIPGRAPGFIWGEEEFRSLRRAWISALVHEPGAYLRHRWVVFKGVLGFAGPASTPYWFGETEMDQDPTFNRFIKKDLVRRLGSLQQAVVFKGGFYIGVILLTLILGWRWGAKNPVAFYAMALSALLYEAGYFVMAPSPAFRYSWWPMGVCLMLPALLKIPRRVSDTH